MMNLSLQTFHLLFPTNLDDEDQENEEMQVNSAFPIRTLMMIVFLLEAG